MTPVCLGCHRNHRRFTLCGYHHTVAVLHLDQNSAPDRVSRRKSMLTAKGRERDVLTGLSGGAADYIVKPFAQVLSDCG